MSNPLQLGYILRWQILGWMLACLLLAVGSAAGQPTGTVRGTVVAASTGAPIAQATVSVRGMTGVGATTDEKGRVRIGIPAGEQVLRIRAAGYCASEHRISVAPGRYTRLEVELSPLRTCLRASSPSAGRGPTSALRGDSR